MDTDKVILDWGAHDDNDGVQVHSQGPSGIVGQEGIVAKDAAILSGVESLLALASGGIDAQDDKDSDIVSLGGGEEPWPVWPSEIRQSPLCFFFSVAHGRGYIHRVEAETMVQSIPCVRLSHTNPTAADSCHRAMTTSQSLLRRMVPMWMKNSRERKHLITERNQPNQKGALLSALTVPPLSSPFH